MKVLRKLIKYPLKHKRRIIIVFLLLIINSLIGLSTPYLFKRLIDDVLIAREIQGIYIILAILLGLGILSAIVNYYYNNSYRFISNLIVCDLRSDVFSHLINLSYSFYNDKRKGEIIQRLNNEINRINNFISGGTFTLLSSLFTLIGIYIAIALLNFKLFIITISVLPLHYYIARHFQPKIRSTLEKVRKKESSILSFFLEVFENLKIVQINNRYKYENMRLFNLQKDYIKLDVKSVRIGSYASSLAILIGSVTPLLIFGIGANDVVKGIMSVGSLVAFMQYYTRSLQPFRNIMGLYLEYNRIMVSTKRVFEFMEHPSQFINTNDIKIDFKNSISFNNVSFRYKNRNILNDLNIEFKKGGKYALVGSSGNGKSTVINLLCRFFKPEKGNISIDGVDINDIDIRNYTSKISLITQDYFLFNKSIIDNIKYGNLKASFEEIEEISKHVDLYQDIKKFENGFQTFLGDSAVNISGGQKQRIAIARGLIKDAEIIILDEATSELSSDSERHILDNLIKYYKDRTIIIISHRVTSIKDMDQIFLIDKGKVIEQGSHQELVEKKKHYYELFYEQLSTELVI